LDAAGLDLAGNEPIPPLESSCERWLRPGRSDAAPAIIALSHSDGLHVVSIANKLGVKIPDDVSVVTFGDYRSSQWMTEKLTTATFPPERLGTRAVDLLLGLSSGRITQPVREEFPAHLILRNSVSPKSAQDAPGRA